MTRSNFVPHTLKFVNHDQIMSILDTRKPIGKYVSVDPDGNCIAIDNRTGEAWQESFQEFSKAVTYASGQCDIKHLIQIMDLPVGRQYDHLKILFTSYTIYRASENLYEIDRTADGWLSASCTRETLFYILTGMASFSDLDFT